MPLERATPYRSRSLIEVERSINECTDTRKRLILHARRAALLAQSSQTEQARQLVLDLRVINKGFEVRLSSWIMYCEAMIYHSESLDNRGALERLRRAHPFACSIKDADLAGSCAAWLAHCYFGLGEHKNIAQYLSEAFEWALPDRWSPLTRAALTLADTLEWAGSHDVARDWYREARYYASRDGNVMMQNSIIYNSAAFRTSQIWLKKIDSVSSDRDKLLAETEVDSAETFNALLRNTSNYSMIPLLRAELLAALGRHQDAINEFDRYFEEAATPSLQRYASKLLAEMALSVALCGDLSRSEKLSIKALENIDDCRDFDDLAVIQYCLAKIAEMKAEGDRADYHHEACRVYLSEFRRIQQETRDEILPVSAELMQKLKTKKGLTMSGPSET